MVRPKLKAAAYCQGLGRHSQEEAIELTNEAIKSISAILGTKKFILGNEPCEEDCALFGILSQILWCAPDSPFEALLNGKKHQVFAY